MSCSRSTLFPDESAAWVESIRQTPVNKPPYRKIVETIESVTKEVQESICKLLCTSC